MDLKGKVAMVTGGGRGIGLAVSEMLAELGAHVVLGGTNFAVVEQSASAIRERGGSAGAIRINVADAKEVQAAFESVIEQHQTLDILVNNAGVTKDGLLVRMKEDDWNQVLDVNLKGAFLCGQQAIKQMMKQRSGAIVNVSSVVGLTGNFGQANYAASKAGLIGLTKTMAREVASRGIRVNAVAPGFIDSDMTKKLDDKIKDDLLQKIPMGRFGTPRDVAESVCFLVSDSASYITGTVLNINGGMLM
jgi:3-oxoacyl-[acyl-carrier protein] reductase